MDRFDPKAPPCAEAVVAHLRGPRPICRRILTNFFAQRRMEVVRRSYLLENGLTPRDLRLGEV